MAKIKTIRRSEIENRADIYSEYMQSPEQSKEDFIAGAEAVAKILNIEIEDDV